MKAFISSFASDIRANPDAAFLFGVIFAGEVAAVSVCAYFAVTFPAHVL